MNTTKTSADFSVLMSVYKNDNPQQLESALQSIVNQSLPAKEIVLVKDGPVSVAVEELIASTVAQYPDVFNVVTLASNRGLGQALAIGLQTCQYDIVARMDADDICLPDRFAKQYNYLREHPQISVLGGFISEFETDPAQPKAYRKVALKHEAIKRSASSLNPMNHVTVMLRKTDVLAAGNYRHAYLIEDYDLWVRMLAQDFIFENLDEVLVQVRVGVATLDRRHGLEFLKSYLRIYRLLWRSKMLSLPRFLLLSSIQAVVRLMPFKLFKPVYSVVRWVWNSKSQGALT